MPVPIDTILLVSAVVLIVAIVAARIGTRVGLPSLLLFLGLGMVLGDSGFGIPFDDPYLAKALAFAALVVILAEGGLTTKWSDIRSSTALAAVLATLGVGVSVALMTLFGYYVLKLDLQIAILLGAVTSPTDAAAVFSVLRRVPIPQRLRGALEAESGLNDAPTVLLVTLASAAAAGQSDRGPPRSGRRHHGRTRRRCRHRDRARLGRRPDPSPRRTALVRPLPAGHAGLGGVRLQRDRQRAPERLCRGLRVRADAGQRPAAPPSGHPKLRRGHRVDRPDRAVRDARSPGLPEVGHHG